MTNQIGQCHHLSTCYEPIARKTLAHDASIRKSQEKSENSLAFFLLMEISGIFCLTLP
jgi:hypothetical protein